MSSSLQVVANTFPEGQGEPINVVISGNSDERVLQQTETNGGLINYFMCVLVLSRPLRNEGPSCCSLPYNSRLI